MKSLQWIIQVVPLSAYYIPCQDFRFMTPVSTYATHPAFLLGGDVAWRRNLEAYLRGLRNDAVLRDGGGGTMGEGLGAHSRRETRR